ALAARVRRVLAPPGGVHAPRPAAPPRRAPRRPRHAAGGPGAVHDAAADLPRLASEGVGTLAVAAAVLSLGCPPPPPPPVVHLLTQPRWVQNTLVTEYWPSRERWFTGRLGRASGIPGRPRVDWVFGR